MNGFYVESPMVNAAGEPCGGVTGRVTVATEERAAYLAARVPGGSYRPVQPHQMTEEQHANLVRAAAEDAAAAG